MAQAGPLVESTRNDIRLTAPLTAISAAVVGVIVSLAVFFAQCVFHIAQPARQWDLLAIALAACVALCRFKIGTIKLILICALAGLAASYLR